ncbi:CAP domain-containing protein [Streptomyces sp. W1SF4]|uniref:CAP domain-containing protein n=1 Tax=Streptomyces sp. W1SF4 TaxID=2305220 RepID=UPI000F6CFA4A|nr:CAP domain-containing protein [Streptomyces sp. W1SF4]AZM87353.1 CAP domain-containing protein [Streptomyces sp. W1SF4]
MKKHRKKTHHRKIAVAVGALAAVAVPTAAMACLDTQDAGRARPAAARLEIPSDPAAAPLPEQAPVPAAAPAQPVAEAPAPAAPAAEEPAARPADPVVEAAPPVRPRQPRPEPVEASAAPAAPAAPQAAGALPEAQAKVLELVNQARAAAGCPALTVNEKLTKAAQDHSADMAAHRNMSHTGSDGSDAGQRITRAGYQWRTYGENVAYGYSSPEQVMEGWMNSPGHRRNILDCSYKEIGIGLAQPGQYWTQDFGATR